METLQQVKDAVEAGQTVHWINGAYTVIHDSKGQWLIQHSSGSATGLFWSDGETSDYKPADFYTA